MTYVDHLFKRRRFDRVIITLCIRWVPQLQTNYRDLVVMMGELGLKMVHPKSGS